MADISVINIYIHEKKMICFLEIGLNELSLGQKCQKRMKRKSLRGFTQSPAVVVAPSGQFLQIRSRYI